jgi:hypothetical protein
MFCIYKQIFRAARCFPTGSPDGRVFGSDLKDTGVIQSDGGIVVTSDVSISILIISRFVTARYLAGGFPC